MNGPHDMGGMQCYGPVIPEPNEPVFHANWEKKALALTVAMGFTGSWNIDISRHSRESLPPSTYLSLSYYQIWLAGLEKLMLQRGMVTNDELENGKMTQDPVVPRNVLKADETPAALAAGGPVSRDTTTTPAYEVGGTVRARNINPMGHTRLPRYVRGAQGTIIQVQGCHVFPDTNSKGEDENPQWLYSVGFEAEVLFGESAEPNAVVMVDCWEPYLERA